MNNLQHRLLVNKGPEPGKVYELTSVSMTIGRDPMVEIVINDPEVSRRHARLIGTLTGYRIQDLGSTNGTLVDSVRLGGEPVDLVIGQVISIGGGVAMVFQSIDDYDVQAVIMLETAMVPPVVEEPVEQPDLPGPEVQESVEQPDLIGIEPEDDELVVSSAGEIEIDDAEGAKVEFVEEEPEQPSSEEPSYQATILEPAEQKEEETIPPIYDEPESYEAKDFSDPVVIPHQGEPEQPQTTEKSSNYRRLSTIIAALLLLVICCCCSFMLFLYYYGGDWLLRQMGLLP